MPTQPSYQSGRHFLQIPGPTNVPERVSHALARSTIDHRGPDFAQMTLSILERLQTVFETTQPVLIYPSSATGCWEAALVNTLSPGDKVLFCESGHFAARWIAVASQLGLVVERLESDWRQGIDPTALAARLAEDRAGAIKAVCLVHNETSTGVVNDVAAMRQAMDNAKHNALLMVDVVSSIGSMDYRHDAWGVDVTVAGSQKGLMLPPGLGFNVVSEKALATAQSATLPKSYWDWQPVIEFNGRGVFPYTPATNLFYGLDVALDMLLEEGLSQVFARHQRLAAATRAAVDGWGLEVYCQHSDRHSPTLTAVLMPDGHDADALRSLILERFNMSLGTGLGPLKGKLFRIGHLGDFNELMLAGTLCGIEMGLALAKVPCKQGGVLDGLAEMNRL